MTTFFVVLVLGTAVWAALSLVLATVIGRAIAAGEHLHQMDGLYRSVGWDL